MVGWTKARRQMLVDKLPDAANLALAGLLFGQFVGSRPFSLAVAVAGVITWATLGGLAYLIGGDE